MPVRDPDEQKRIRLELCDPCEFKKDARCGKCGCYLRAKVKMATEACPVGKWMAIPPAE